MANDRTYQITFRLHRLVFVVAAGALLLAVALMSAAPASAALCITPDHGPGQSNTGDYVAEAPVAPEDFADRGASMNNRAGKQAAWEAHFNAPAVEGPESRDELFADD